MAVIAQLPQGFPKRDTPAVEPETGLWSIPWYQLMVSFWNKLGNFNTPVYAFASLPTPTANLIGARATVTDANGPVFLAVVVGGGAVMTPVFCDGTDWRCG